jgi:hypothetical protein
MASTFSVAPRYDWGTYLKGFEREAAARAPFVRALLVTACPTFAAAVTASRRLLRPRR